MSGAGAAVRAAVRKVVEEKNDKVVANGMRAVNAIRNSELQVLSGNPSPSPPGSPPGRRSGRLRLAWTGSVRGGFSGGGGGVLIVPTLESGAYYSGYVNDGTRKMAARPFADKIAEGAVPEIMSIFSSI